MPTSSKRRRSAMMDMGVAFGKGAAMAKPKIEWAPEVAASAEKWLADRLQKTKKDYWDPQIRSAALTRAQEVGGIAAGYAQNNFITEKNFRDALNSVGIGKGPGPRGYCPF